MHETSETFSSSDFDDSCFSTTLVSATFLNVRAARKFLDNLAVKGKNYFFSNIFQAFATIGKDLRQFANKKKIPSRN